jgi:hypothetical protein
MHAWQVAVGALSVTGLGALSILQAYLISTYGWPQELANYLLLGLAACALVGLVAVRGGVSIFWCAVHFG